MRKPALGLDFIKYAYQTKSNQIKLKGDLLSDPTSDLFLGVTRNLSMLCSGVERDFLNLLKM
jgi:hypothetical protein